MKIIFFGTPEFAVFPLKKLIDNHYNVVAVVTVPDKPQGRGLKITYSPVKQFAVDRNIPVLQPDDLKSESFQSKLQSYEADLFIVVAFKILPKDVFNMPVYGTFNLHGSLLPKYRGAAPIQWSLINGDEETGLTTFFLQEKVDTGNIILQNKVRIQDEDNFESLYNRMAEIGSDLVIETVEKIKLNNISLLQQDNSLSSLAPKITKELCQIEWNKAAIEIHNLVRGLSPFPGAFFKHSGKTIKVYKTEISNEIELSQGEFLCNKNNLYVGCENKTTLSLLTLQMEGKKALPIDEFLRGYAKLFQ